MDPKTLPPRGTLDHLKDGENMQRCQSASDKDLLKKALVEIAVLEEAVSCLNNELDKQKVKKMDMRQKLGTILNIRVPKPRNTQSNPPTILTVAVLDHFIESPTMSSKDDQPLLRLKNKELNSLLGNGIPVEQIAALNQWPESKEVKKHIQHLQDDVCTLRGQMSLAKKSYEEKAREGITITREWQNRKEKKSEKIDLFGLPPLFQEASRSPPVNKYRDQNERGPCVRGIRYSPFCASSAWPNLQCLSTKTTAMLLLLLEVNPGRR
ncbi:hypothetical protein NDU88_003496 [Pleurodeles waltl]|uniref:Uncharacterized protein n=1 Tax=Pleurodeles waltl TaxID=8319 RepID=A0AAV7MYP2_PLEWA|nr:hypothetical protein NDU88_003496 [Pleurodeles waltl]